MPLAPWRRSPCPSALAMNSLNREPWFETQAILLALACAVNPDLPFRGFRQLASNTKGLYNPGAAMGPFYREPGRCDNWPWVQV